MASRWETHRRAALYIGTALSQQTNLAVPYLDALLMRLLERALHLSQPVVARDVWRNRDPQLVQRLRYYGGHMPRPVAMVYDACINALCEAFSVDDAD